MTTTIIVAIAAAVIGFIIGLIVGMADVTSTPGWVPHTEPKKAEQHPMPAVTSKVVLPKRISKDEYTKRVSACLKEAVTKVVDTWVVGDDKAHKRQVVNSLYAEWHGRLAELAYSNYNPQRQRLDIIGRRLDHGFKFDAFWSSKNVSDYEAYFRNVGSQQ